ncbi:MAG: hypothetical protein ABR508_09765, partial [Candidatus Baltobacteraceae bacterium]
VLAAQTSLVAPTLVAQPLYTPPAVETSGAYRLSTLDARIEAPCVLAYNQDRAALGLAPAVVDEWLLENTRGIQYVINSPNGGGQTINFLTWGTGHSYDSGGANCASSTIQQPGVFTTPTSQALGANALWFAGSWSEAVVAGGVAVGGSAQFPIDPRIAAQSSSLSWP